MGHVDRFSHFLREILRVEEASYCLTDGKTIDADLQFSRLNLGIQAFVFAIETTGLPIKREARFPLPEEPVEGGNPTNKLEVVRVLGPLRFRGGDLFPYFPGHGFPPEEGVQIPQEEEQE